MVLLIVERSVGMEVANNLCEESGICNPWSTPPSIIDFPSAYAPPKTMKITDAAASTNGATATTTLTTIPRIATTIDPAT